MQIEEKPPGTPPFATPFEWMGGEDKVKALVERFYDLMDIEPAYTALRAAHGRVIGVRHQFRCGASHRTLRACRRHGEFGL